MAVALDAVATGFQSVPATTSITTVKLTVGSGANRGLVCQACWGAASGIPVTSRVATWDFGGSAQAMGEIVNQVSGTLLETALYGLVNPIAGAKSLKIAWVNNADCDIFPIAFTGVDQTGGATSFPNSTSATGSASPATVTVTTATNNATVSCIAVGGNPAGPNRTQTFLDTAPANMSAAGEYLVPSGAGSLAHQWSTAGGAYVTVVTDVLAAATAGDTQEWGSRSIVRQTRAVNPSY